MDTSIEDQLRAELLQTKQQLEALKRQCKELLEAKEYLSKGLVMLPDRITYKLEGMI